MAKVLGWGCWLTHFTAFSQASGPLNSIWRMPTSVGVLGFWGFSRMEYFSIMVVTLYLAANSGSPGCDLWGKTYPKNADNCASAPGDLWSLGKTYPKSLWGKKMPQAFDNIGLAANMATTAARGSQSLVFWGKVSHPYTIVGLNRLSLGASI